MDSTGLTSNKAIWTLLSATESLTEKGVLESELESSLPALTAGCLVYKPNSTETASAFKQRKDVTESWREFVVKLSRTLGLEEGKAWSLVCNYLATEFRGTSTSLKELLKHEQQVKPLMYDVWQFYRAERLYLLQIVKEIISNQENTTESGDASDDESRRKSLYHFIFKKMCSPGGAQKFKKSLIDQLKALLKEKPPVTDNLGHNLGRSCRKAWMHFNLREINELLQILLIFFHKESIQCEDILVLSSIFQDFGFGTKLSYKNELDETNTALVNSIGYLCGLILGYLMDLPSLSVSTENHVIWSTADNVMQVERVISGLGSLAAHSPPMLCWLLSSYLARGSDGLGKATRLGEIAINHRVLDVMRQSLLADYTSHSLVADIIYAQVFTALSVLITGFDHNSMGLSVDVEHLAVLLLKHPAVAKYLWKNGPDQGLGLFVADSKANFPENFSGYLNLLISLAGASSDSCANVVSSLSSLNVYAEWVGHDLAAADIQLGRDPSEVILQSDRFPYPDTETICIPAKSRGKLLENGTVQWSVNLNGWQLLLAECGLLNSQIAGGEERVRAPTLRRVSLIAKLMAAIIDSSPDMSGRLTHLTGQLLHIAYKFCLVTRPPLDLLKNVLQVHANLASDKARSSAVLRNIAASGLIPRFAKSSAVATLDTGIVGYLLAREETVTGDYSLLLSFLKLLLNCGTSEEARAGILFIVREVLPVFYNWRYENPGDREKIVTLSLAAVHEFISSVPYETELLAAEAGLGRSLLHLVSSGDRTIQTLLENQVTWETGRGSDLIVIVESALKILHILLSSESSAPSVMAGPLGSAIRSPPSGPTPHLLLTLMHYAHFFHSPNLAICAIRLLAEIARGVPGSQEAPVSILACLSSSAPAVKELLLSRLDSPMEDIRLKIEIVNLLSACVEMQPGMVQLLLDINPTVVVVDGAKKSSSNGKGNESGGETTSASPNSLVGEGCLSPILQFLSQCKSEKSEQWVSFHLVILRFIHGLWDQSQLLATSYLKNQKEFWEDLCWPVTNPSLAVDPKYMKIKGYILRIMSQEIYFWKGNVNSGLSKVLEKICEEKSTCMDGWCDSVEELASQGKAIQSETFADVADADENVSLFLLSAWRTFILVVSKDCPSIMSPSACRSTFAATLKSLSACLDLDTINPQLTVLLAETGSVLLKRWQTKCADNMETLCKDVSEIIAKVGANWHSLHARARVSLLAMAVSSLRVSMFKLEQGQEEKILETWLQPSLSILCLNFQEVENIIAQHFESGNRDKSIDMEHLQSPELSICLLRTLLSRFSHDRIWLRQLHSEATIQLLLSAASACCKHKVAPTFVNRILHLLCEISMSKAGSESLIMHELARDLWLPLADSPGDSNWMEVRLSGLEVATSLLHVGQRQAVPTAITAAALLQDHIVTDLLAPREKLSGLATAVRVCRFISSLANYSAPIWRTEHEASLLIIYRCCCMLIHKATALLMRPSLLTSMLKVSNNKSSDEESKRSRRVSTVSEVQEMEAVPAEAILAHSQLLDISCSCLLFFSSLSPPLTTILAGEAQLDLDRWEPLLMTNYSNPSLEQSGEVPSYGTLLALGNMAVRTLTKDTARSPSPARSCTSPLRPPSRSSSLIDTPERRKLMLVMERSLTVVLCQSLLSLSSQAISQRDKQLLKREVGAEVKSITDTWLRFAAKTAGGGSSGGKSPGPSASSRGTKSPSAGSHQQTSGLSTRPTPPPQSPLQQHYRASSSASAAGGSSVVRPEDQCVKLISSLARNMYK